MEARILCREKLGPLIDAWCSQHQVIAPADELAYKVVASSQEIYLSEGKPRRSLKEFFFPNREELFAYTQQGRDVSLVDRSAATTGTSRVVFGARPCEVYALTILDKVFGWDYRDASYLERRRNTTIVSLACREPAATCFCTSLGGSPTSPRGTDLLFTPLEDVYYIESVTERGQALVDECSTFFQASDVAHDRARARFAQQAEARIARRIDVSTLPERLRFDSPVWAKLTEQCLDCGVCTFLCPTCHCFDIQDEGRPERGVRVRLWDSCAFREFTKTAVSQPRPTHSSRYRQRIMHKFNYYPSNFHELLCVGCGRCIEHCPAGIDIRQVLETVKE